MASTSSLVEVAFKASDLSVVARKALESIPVDANVILPIFNKCLELDKVGQSPLDHLWIAIYSRPDTVALVLSHNEGPMGAYPVFIVNTIPIDDNDFTSCIHLSVLTLQRYVPIERVYSVFGPNKITQLFSKMWTQLTGEQLEAAKLCRTFASESPCFQHLDTIIDGSTADRWLEMGFDHKKVNLGHW